MSAIKVYGIAIGDSFIAEDGRRLTVVKFLTPEKMHLPWLAKVQIDNGLEAEVEVKDLKTENYRRIQE